MRLTFNSLIRGGIAFCLGGLVSVGAQSLQESPTERFVAETVPLGASVTVTVLTSPPSGSFVHAIEEIPPLGWMVDEIGSGGIWDEANRKIKWGPFLDTDSRELSYRLVAPDLEVRGVISGSISIDGVDTATPGPLSIRVENPLRPPSIIRNLEGGTVSEGLEWSFEILVESEVPVTFQWWKEGRVLENQVSNRLDFGSVGLGDAGLYWVTVSNEDGTVDSDRVVLTVEKPDPIPLARRILPESVEAGNAFQVRLAVTPPIGTLAYAIEEVGPPGAILGAIHSDGVFDSIHETIKWGPFLGDDPIELVYEMAVFGEDGPAGFEGRVSVDGIVVGVEGDSSILVRTSPPVEPPRIILGLSNVVAVEGDFVRLEVLVQSELPVRYQWYRRGEPLIGATQNHLEFSGVAFTDTDSYQVQVSSDAGSTVSDVVTLTVDPAPPKAAVQRVSPETIEVGSTVRVSLIVSPPEGTFAYAVEEIVPVGWRVGALSEEGEFDVVNQKIKWGPFLGATERELTFELLAPSIATTSTYTGSLSLDGQEFETAGVSSIRVVAQSLSMAPVLVEDLQGGTITLGQPWEFAVSVESLDSVVFKWFQNGVLQSSVSGARLQLDSVGSSDAGEYWVRAQNSFGTVESSRVVLHVTDLDLAPSVERFAQIVVGNFFLNYGFHGNSRFVRLGESGNWEYDQTGLTSGVLEFTYDNNGEDSTGYREVFELEFVGDFTGTYSYYELDGAVRSGDATGEFSRENLRRGVVIEPPLPPLPEIGSVVIEGFGIRRGEPDRIQLFWNERSRGVALLQRSRDLQAWEDFGSVDLDGQTFIELPVTDELPTGHFFRFAE